MPGRTRRAVILGGGITGTLTGAELCRAGWSVVLLEGQHVGAGSSSRTAAGIRQQFSTRETVVGMRYAVRYYRDWAARLGGLVCPIQQSGYLFLYDEPTAWAAARRRAADQRAWGLQEVEDLAGPELAARFPWVDPGVVIGGTWCPSDGFLRPEAVYNDAAAALQARGGQLVQRAPVTGARRGPGGLLAVQTPRGEFEGDLFIDCTNAWTRRTGALLGATPLPVAALRRYLWFLERGGALDAATLMAMPLTISPAGVYCRPEGPGSLLLGWKHEAPDESADFTYEDQDRIEAAHFHRTGADARPYEAWLELARVIPPIGDFAGFTATTAGYYGSTPDHNPYLDYDPLLPNLIRLVGFSGHGAMFGPFTAAVALALAEAGGPVEHVSLDGERAELAAFRIGRQARDAESMVI